MLTLTAIIPVLNGAEVLPRCLESLRRSSTPPLECIVVDDGSTDGSASIAELAGATVLRGGRTRGPGAARNLGAANASGDIVVFIDADVCVQPDSLDRIREAFEADASLSALIGSYDDEPDAAGTVSQFKNLFHHYVHQHGRRQASTFWSGCGAIRREIFLASGGFDESYVRPCIEDIELGSRLRERGCRIELDAALQVKHLKAWRLSTLLRSDIFDRALPWTRLILSSACLPNDLNLSVSQRMSTVLTLASVGLAVAGIWKPYLAALAPVAIAGTMVLNLDFYRFVAAKSGWRFAVRAFPLHALYYLYSGLALGTGVILHFLSWRWRDSGHTSRAWRARQTGGERS